ncbi:MULTISPECIES: hypothetical protein [unclassified Actinoplanes]|uniref:hypothetical protein n=1 Tax=unclassified Actinoplanes TaxID=2626549 RepID=UPI0005BE1841|nr:MULTISPECIES: hypothetical protein [unclassified Actinoplanes]
MTHARPATHARPSGQHRAVRASRPTWVRDLDRPISANRSCDRFHGGITDITLTNGWWDNSQVCGDTDSQIYLLTHSGMPVALPQADDDYGRMRRFHDDLLARINHDAFPFDSHGFGDDRWAGGHRGAGGGVGHRRGGWDDGNTDGGWGNGDADGGWGNGDTDGGDWDGGDRWTTGDARDLGDLRAAANGWSGDDLGRHASRDCDKPSRPKRRAKAAAVRNDAVTRAETSAAADDADARRSTGDDPAATGDRDHRTAGDGSDQEKATDRFDDHGDGIAITYPVTDD